MCALVSRVCILQVARNTYVEPIHASVPRKLIAVARARARLRRIEFHSIYPADEYVCMRARDRTLTVHQQNVFS